MRDFEGIEFFYLFNKSSNLPNDLALPTTKCVFTSAKPFGFWEQFELIWIMKRFDLFWATSLSHPFFLFRKRLVATVHDVAQLDLTPGTILEFFKFQIIKIFLLSISLKSRLVFFNSLFTKTRYKIHFPRNKHASIITELGSRFVPKKFNFPELSNQTKRFLIVGNARPHKNLLFAINGFFALSETSDYDLHIIGSRHYSSEIVSLAASNSRLKLHGFLSDAELIKMFSDSTALIFPSLYEGFGLPALEAMSQGCPVIVSSNTSLPEVCFDAGFYFDPNDLVSYKAALLNFLHEYNTNPSELVMSSINRSKVFSWEFCIEKTFDGLKSHFIY